jgi:hypothetical protein
MLLRVRADRDTMAELHQREVCDILNDVADHDAILAMVEENVIVVAESTVLEGASEEQNQLDNLRTAMIYGLLLGHRLALDAGKVGRQ